MPEDVFRLVPIIITMFDHGAPDEQTGVIKFL